MSMHPHGACWETFALRQLVEEVVQALGPRLTTQGIQTVIDVPLGQMMTADRESMRKAIRNLMLNAAAAMPDGGTLTATSAARPDAVILEIADSGPSLSEAGLRHAFDLAGIAERGATGCTLAIVRRIAQIHHGSLSVANCPEGGVALTLRVPRPIALEAAA